MQHADSYVTQATVSAAKLVPTGLAFLDMRGAYKLAQHLELIDDALCRVERGECKRLVIEMPPRHGKSLLSSRYFPAWYLGRNPDHRVMLASYGADLAADFGRGARDVLEQWGKQVFGIAINPSSSAANRWDIHDHRGGMTTAGVGGPMTGRGANLLIIDDPVKNREDAESETLREKQWNWYTSTAYTRLEPDGAIIVIQTRWHEDDLAGRIQRAALENGEAWEVLRLPAVCDSEDDALGRSVGDALWPDRYDATRLSEIQQSVGSYVWNALYQQRPVALEGNMVKREWFKYYDEPPPTFDRVTQSWDLTFKATKNSDYVVGQVWGEVGADSYLLYQYRQRADYPQTKQAIRMVSELYPEAHEKLVEDKANGPAIMSELGREITGLVPVEPNGGKIARLVAASPQIESGNVHLPNPTKHGWVDALLTEVCAFPNAPNDDQVDAMSQYLVRKLQRRRPRLRSLAG